MIINLVRAMCIDEISREISYGGQLSPLGYYIEDYSMLFVLDYNNILMRLYVVDSTYSHILKRYMDNIDGRIRIIKRDKSFKTDFDIRAEFK